jgi:hypothetical protein
MIIRKVIIGAASLFVAVLLFVGYISLTGTKGIPVSTTSQIADIPDRPTTGGSQIDKTNIIGLNQAVYPVIDPQTRKVIRVFGFDSLLNPGQKSNNWQVSRPYMNVFEKKFCCRLDAEEGFIQMETSGGKAIPKDARLTGSVVVRVFPKQDQRFSETVILLDDLNYSSERSEFFTDGPVELISAQARLVGRGLQMIYNPQNQRIEYFQIKKLDYLRIKNAVASHILGKPSESAVSSEAPVATDSISQNTAPVTETAKQDAKGNEATAPAKDKFLYQCSVRKDVVIQYGRELIVQGADEVNIHNILFGSTASDSLDAKETTEPEASEPVLAQDQKESPDENPLAGIGWADRGRRPQTPADDDNLDVVVLCQGGIVVQPMNGTFNTDPAAAMDIRMTGSPMRVMRQNPNQKGQSLPLIQCQSLAYNPSAEIVKLFAGNMAKLIRVFMDTDRNYLETPGDMMWNIKDRYAQVNGSGRIVFDSAMQKQSEQAEVNFGRQMDVFFAEAPDTTDGQLFLTAVNLTGGMNAVMGRDGFKTEADSARFEFGQANQLAKAMLNGDVRFASDSTSRGAADEALLTFAPENTLKVADLKGNVAFASAQGQFSSNDAKIQFAKNESGQLEPQSLTSTTDASLVSAVSDPALPPAKFEAKKMDYDLVRGSAFALGPIRFSFNTPADANDPGSSQPVVITAQRNAEFLAGPDKKSIQQVIFHGDVVGESVEEKDNEKTMRRFYGDTLTVDFAADIKGRTDISHVAVTDGDVKLQAIGYLDGTKINHVELHCVRFDYEGVQKTITAMGPGKIELNNQEIAADTEAAGQQQAFDFRQPCYALMEGFDKLIWRTNDQKLMVDGKKDTLNLSYLTMKNNVPDKLTRAAVSTAELFFAKDEKNKNILSRLTADGGVYVEQKDEYMFKGQKMQYTGNDNWLHIEGSESQPCYVNGALASEINYNIKTGELKKTKLSKSPGVVIVPQ